MEDYTKSMERSMQFLNENKFVEGREHFQRLRDGKQRYDDAEGPFYFSYQCLYCKYLIFLGNYRDVKKLLEDQVSDIEKYKDHMRFSNLELLRAYSSHLLGIAYFHLGEYNNAIRTLKISLAKLICEKRFIRIADTCRALGRAYAAIGNYDEAWTYFYKAISILFKKGQKLFLLPLTLNELGITFCQNDKLSNAKRCANLCELFIDKHSYEKDHLLLGYNQNLLGEIKKKEWKLKRENVKSDQLSDIEKEAYQDKNDQEVISILQCFYKAQEIIKNTTQNENHARIARIYNNISRIDTGEKNYEGSLDCNNKALTIYKKCFKSTSKDELTHHPFISKTYRDIGYTFLFQNNFELALQNFQEAIIAVVRGFRKKEISANPKVISSNIDSSRYLLAALDRKVDALIKYYKATGQSKYLDYAADTINVACQLIESIKNDSFQRRVNFFYRKRTRLICEKILFIFLNKKDLNSKVPIFKNIQNVFRQFEKLRMLSFIDDFREYNVRRMDSLNPDSYIKCKRKISELIISFEGILLNGKGRSIREIMLNKKKFNRFYDEILGMEEKFSGLKEDIDRVLKNRNISYQPEDITTKKIQEEALDDENAAIINYFLGERYCFAFIISKNDIQLVDLCPGSLFNRKKAMKQIVINSESIRDIFIKSPTDFQKIKKKEFIKLTNHLYQQLFKPIEPYLELEKQKMRKRIYIIPDQQLAYIPFDVLLTKRPSKNVLFSQLPYLVRKHCFSYHYSATLLCLEYITRNKRPKSKIFLSGFAPDSTLKYTQKTMDSLNMLFKNNGYNNNKPPKKVNSKSVKIFQKGDANLKNYKKWASKSEFLHITSHANTPLYQNNPMDSEIYLYKKEKLKVSQILYSKLSAKLAVLACCQTGDLSLRIDEDVISFKRAYLIAGVPNVIYSIYDALDTLIYHDMTVKFYEFLLEGIPFAESLRKAKIFAIESKDRRGDDKANPQVWAGMAFMGDQTHSMHSLMA